MAKFLSLPARTPVLQSGASHLSSTMQKFLLNDLPNRLSASPVFVNVPASADAPGVSGEMAISADGTILYVCVAQNSWRKLTLVPF